MQVLDKSAEKRPMQMVREGIRAFNKLKQLRSQAPVLALPGFSQPFILEFDASQVGIGDESTGLCVTYLSLYVQGEVVCI